MKLRQLIIKIRRTESVEDKNCHVCRLVKNLLSDIFTLFVRILNLFPLYFNLLHVQTLLNIPVCKEQ